MKPPSDTLTGAERVLAMLDVGPWGAVYRVALGFLTVPVASFFWGSRVSGVSLGSFLLAVLFALRAGSVVARELLPFSGTLRELWRRRRHMAKRHDSYQWRKLFWIGLGLAAHIVSARGAARGQVAVAAVCLAGGVAGMRAWRYSRRPIEQGAWITR